MVVDRGVPFRCVFYHVIGDSVLSFDLLKCSRLVTRTHGFKSDEVELTQDVDVIVLV